MTEQDRSAGGALAPDRRHYLVAAGVMTVCLAAFFGPLFLRHETFSAVADLQQYSHPWRDVGAGPLDLYTVSPQVDQANYVHPRQVFLDRVLEEDHRVPLWNPMTFGGHPFFAESGSRLAYPPLLQLSVLFDASWTHDLYVMLHLFVAGVAAFALMRTFGVGLGGALLTGVAWAFCSYTLGWVMLEMIAAPSALLPIGLLCVRRWYDRRSWATLLAGAFVLGLLFLGTTVEFALFCFLCVGGYAAALAIVRVVREWRYLTPVGRVAVLAAPAVLVIAALAVATVALLPFLDLASSSDRASRSPFARESTSVPVRLFRHVLTPPPVPGDVFGAVGILVAGQVFVGTATAILAAVGLFLRRPGSALGRALVIVLFLFTAGTPVTWLALLAIPRLSALNGFGRALFLWDLGLAVLGGLGLDALLRLLRARGAGAANAPARRAWTVLAGSVAALCIVVTGVQLLAYGRRVNPPLQEREAADLYPSTPAVEATRSALGPTRGRGRVIPVSHSPHLPVMHGATSMAVDLPSAGGYEPVLPATVTKLARVIAGEPVESALSKLTPGTFLARFPSNTVRTDLLGRAGITAVMGSPDLVGDPTWGPAALAARGLRQTYAGPDATVYEVLGRPPRASVVTDAIWAKSSPEALRRFVSPSFDGRRQVILEGEPSRQPPPSMSAPESEATGVEWREDRPDEIRLAVTAQAPGWLVLLDGWGPGWKATVNGRATDVIRANYNFRAVAVPAGSSTVAFSYRPTSVVVGTWVSVLSTALIGCVLILERVWRARRSRSKVGRATPDWDTSAAMAARNEAVVRRAEERRRRSTPPE